MAIVKLLFSVYFWVLLIIGIVAWELLIKRLFSVLLGKIIKKNT